MPEQCHSAYRRSISDEEPKESPITYRLQNSHQLYKLMPSPPLVYSSRDVTIRRCDALKLWPFLRMITPILTL